MLKWSTLCFRFVRAMQQALFLTIFFHMQIFCIAFTYNSTFKCSLITTSSLTCYKVLSTLYTQNSSKVYSTESTLYLFLNLSSTGF
uniref:Uncharacterized 9.9 kDa protein in DHFR 3'region n=1 Tax=Saimiriine herpesvirus 2 (strain 488) TaxID=10384 RepID=YDH4_SHV2C|nr:RecName: Full=Uncharacterized 9.9 kDa protein in DHFR 3'region; AltName: Full=ORF4 [Herpesvirus saimiri (strain 488)]pir/D34770/ ORF4 protein - saimiriine herpesvirus 1 (strain 488) [Saimiriine alphaherpesvirus 1]AAA72931.1 unnamed protein product [Saimiriine alphaherpesvirus 1]